MMLDSPHTSAPMLMRGASLLQRVLHPTDHVQQDIHPTDNLPVCEFWRPPMERNESTLSQKKNSLSQIACDVRKAVHGAGGARGLLRLVGLFAGPDSDARPEAAQCAGQERRGDCGAGVPTPPSPFFPLRFCRCRGCSAQAPWLAAAG
jgi:hypothetical protein